MIGTYLNEPIDSDKVKAISGIIERRMWSLPPASRGHLQDIAAHIGFDGSKELSIDRLTERIKSEFDRVSSVSK
jgi:hypothetical protein